MFKSLITMVGFTIFFISPKCSAQQLVKNFPNSDFIYLNNAEEPGDEILKGKILIYNPTNYDLSFKITVGHTSIKHLLKKTDASMYSVAKKGYVSYYWKSAGSEINKDTTVVYERKCYTFAILTTNSKSLILRPCN